MQSNTKYFSFIEPYLHTLGDIAGCTEEEILQLEIRFGVRLPEAYKEYLRLFGKNSGELLTGFHTTVDRIDWNRACVEYSLRETVHNNTFIITPDKFFFGQWQGDYYYFICGDNDDPEVFLVADFDEVTSCAKSFTSFVDEEGLQPILDPEKL